MSQILETCQKNTCPAGMLNRIKIENQSKDMIKQIYLMWFDPGIS